MGPLIAQGNFECCKHLLVEIKLTKCKYIDRSFVHLKNLVSGGEQTSTIAHPTPLAIPLLSTHYKYINIDYTLYSICATSKLHFVACVFLILLTK